ncbi:MAG: DUF411 domain-containing protein [Rhizobiaceae bacterium]|nr:DUF411 domain-containing protein [Rhizobiaceae bacterium]
MNELKSILRAATLATTVLVASPLWAEETVEVLKSASCGCCIAWGEHMREQGFAVSEKNVSLVELNTAKNEAGLREEHKSCHTAYVDGYVVEGHVPAEDVRRLLTERPDAIGLAVPGMPFGSPGMGEPGPDAEPYDVLLVKHDGSTEVYSSHP